MISEAKLESNRINAQQSTGPKTPQGKSKSCMNAIKHGLCAHKAILLPGEDEESYRTVHKAMLYDLDPRGMIETIVAEIVIETAWRLRRIPVFEAQVLSYSQNRIAKHHPNWDKDFPDGPNPQESAEWGRVWQYSEKSVVNLRRYENALTRTFFRGLSELRLALKNRSNLDWHMKPHPEIAEDMEADYPSVPPAYSTVLQSGMSAPPVSTPPAERTDPGHSHDSQPHNPISSNDLPATLGSFGKQENPSPGCSATRVPQAQEAAPQTPSLSEKSAYVTTPTLQIGEKP